MSKKYINADALREIWVWGTNDKYGYSECIPLKDLDDFPAADVRENVHGKWIKTIRVRKTEGADYYDPVWFCPACGKDYDAAFASHNIKFCYRCGADMRGQSE